MAGGEVWAGDVRSLHTGKKAASVHQVTAVFERSYMMLFSLKNFCIRSGAKLPKDLLFSFCQFVTLSTCCWKLSLLD